MMLDRKKLFIAIGAAIVVLALIGGGVALVLSRGGPDEPIEDPTRANMLALARDYLEAGEYQRALDLIDQLLIADSSDAEAQTLKAEILAAKQAADAAARAEEIKRQEELQAQLQSRQVDPDLAARQAEANDPRLLSVTLLVIVKHLNLFDLHIQVPVLLIEF